MTILCCPSSNALMNLVAVQFHTYTPDRYPMYGLGTMNSSNNYCRNPSNSAPGVWCYVARGANNTAARRWQYCTTVPFCNDTAADGPIALKGPPSLGLGASALDPEDTDSSVSAARTSDTNPVRLFKMPPSVHHLWSVRRRHSWRQSP
jgi:hypothetical protein